MSSDEQAIRSLVSKWMAASKSGDLAMVLSLMTDDVLFHVPGREPFGKEAFTQASQSAAGAAIEGSADIQEITVLGEWAFMRNRLRVTVTPPGGRSMTRSGYTLTILRKSAGGQWQIFRDANLLAPETST
jgi:uncharacterized protein (TIGR02246 family)